MEWRIWITWKIISGIQDYFEYILKKHGKKNGNPWIRIYVNKIEENNERWWKLTSFRNYWRSIMRCNLVNNDYQQNSRLLYAFVPNKSFGQLLDILPKNIIFLKTFNSEFSNIEVWITDQNSKPLEIEDKINLTSVINQSVKCKK